MTFEAQILEGIPENLPSIKPYDASINHAPKRKDILSDEEKKLALRNALRYFDTDAYTCTDLDPITKCTHALLMSIRQNASKQQLLCS